MSERDDTGRSADTYTPDRANRPKTCANCGATIDTKEWHPLMTETDGDDTFRLYAFCDRDCQEEWAQS